MSFQFDSSFRFFRELRQFRNASSVALDSQWQKVLQLFGNDEFYLYVWGK